MGSGIFYLLRFYVLTLNVLILGVRVDKIGIDRYAVLGQVGLRFLVPLGLS